MLYFFRDDYLLRYEAKKENPLELRMVSRIQVSNLGNFGGPEKRTGSINLPILFSHVKKLAFQCIDSVIWHMKAGSTVVLKAWSFLRVVHNLHKQLYRQTRG